MTNRQVAFKIAKQCGLHIATWSPGDGITRYRVFNKPSDYFDGYGIAPRTILGAKDLVTFMRGYFSACIHASASRNLWS